MPTINTEMVFFEQPFHSFRMMPHTFENTTLSAIRMQNDRVMRVGDSVRNPLPSQDTLENVIAPNLLVLVIAPSMILGVLIETVDGIGDETT